MATLKPFHVQMENMIKNMTLEVNVLVKPIKLMKLRIWLSAKLIIIACYIIGNPELIMHFNEQKR